MVALFGTVARVWTWSESSPRFLMIKVFVPKVMLLEAGGTFAQWNLIGGPYVSADLK